MLGEARKQRVMNDNGIMFDPSAPECQCQNGSVERHMGLVRDLAIKFFMRCTVKNVPISCWCFAVEMVVQRTNTRPVKCTKTNKMITQHESFHGTKPSTKCSLEFGQVALCKSTRAHDEKGGWTLEKKAFQSGERCLQPTHADQMNMQW